MVVLICISGESCESWVNCRDPIHEISELAHKLGLL
jgi:hypothetical protein